jgi:hypothetical protein
MIELLVVSAPNACLFCKFMIWWVWSFNGLLFESSARMSAIRPSFVRWDSFSKHPPLNYKSGSGLNYKNNQIKQSTNETFDICLPEFDYIRKELLPISYPQGMALAISGSGLPPARRPGDSECRRLRWDRRELWKGSLQRSLGPQRKRWGILSRGKWYRANTI